MRFSQYNMRSKAIAMILLIILINAAGIVFVLRNLTYAIIYQQISSLIVVSAVWLLAALVIYRIFISYIYIPVVKVEQTLKMVAKGDLSASIDFNTDDELSAMANSINNIINNQVNAAEFIEKIGDGNFTINFNILSENDRLGYSITGMKEKLHKLVSDDAIRQWSSEGIAKFSTILRENSDDQKALCDRLVSDLVNYLKANQGAIFLINKDNREKPVLDMISVYAWSRKKYLSSTIEIGEGLVGQAALEKETIYLTEVPQNFISITSGLGDTNPGSVIIVPMLFNDEIYGVMEFASFKPYMPFEIEFLEKLSEIIASTLSRSNINKQTQKLLRDSQKLTEELRTQEEEMRQNLEEMNATQEEMQQREVERVGIFTAINNTIATVEFNMDGRIINANDMYLRMMKYTLDEIENKTDRFFSDKSNEPIELYNKFWAELNQGVVQRGDYKKITKDGREIWLSASYTPALDKSGKPYKVIELAQDISEKKRVELELQRQTEELRSQGEKLRTYTTELEDIKQNLSEKLDDASKRLMKKIVDIEIEKEKNIAVLEGCVDGVITFDQEGKIEYFNHSAEEIWGIQRENVLGKSINSIMPVEIRNTDNNLMAYYSNNGSSKEIQVRTEISFSDLAGNNIDLLATVTRSKIENQFTFTIFAQKISMDLF